MILKKYTILIVLFALSGCIIGNKKIIKAPDPVKLSVLLPFKMKIEGVECRLCAQEVERLFSESSDYFGVKYIQSLGSYEDGYLQLQLTHGGRNIDFQAIKEMLRKKDFLLSSIEGEVIGMFNEIEGKRCFQTGNQQSFLVSHERDMYKPISDEYWNQIKHNKQKRIHAKVTFDTDFCWLSL